MSVVVPAYNEEDGIGPTLASLVARYPAAEIIVVDDGSTDRTWERARVGGVIRLRHAFNRGYGAALKTGTAAASRDLTAWFDADNEHRTEDLVRLVERLERESLVSVIGQRTSGVSRFRTAGKAVIRAFAWSLGLRASADLNCGLRVFLREALLPYLSLLPNRFSASMTCTMILVQRGYPIAFESVDLGSRIGTSKVVIGDGFRALVLVLRMIMLFAPLRIFFTVGAFSAVVGTVYGVAIALGQGLGFPTLGVVLILAGLILILQGLIADQMSYMRLSQLEASSPPERLTSRDQPSGLTKRNSSSSNPPTQ